MLNMKVLSLVLWMISATGAVNEKKDEGCTLVGARLHGTKSLMRSGIQTEYKPGEQDMNCNQFCQHKNKVWPEKEFAKNRCTEWSRISESKKLEDCVFYSDTTGYAFKITANAGYASGFPGGCDKLEKAAWKNIEMATPNCFERKKSDSTYFHHVNRIQIESSEPTAPLICQKKCQEFGKGCTNVNFIASFDKSESKPITAFCVFYEVKDSSVGLPPQNFIPMADDDKFNNWSGPANCPDGNKGTKYVAFNF